MAYGDLHKRTDRTMTTMRDPVAREIEALAAAIRAHPLSWREHCVGDSELGGAVSDLATVLDAAGVRQQTERLRAEFETLARQWKDETAGDSTGRAILLHPAHQRIVGMGRPALPLILEDMRQRGGHWFAALRAITGEDPVAAEDAGRVRKMQSAWIEWGRRNGLAS